MKFKAIHAIVIVIVAVLALSAYGYIDLTNLLPAPQPTPQVIPTPQIPGASITPGTHTANAKWQIRDALNKIATASGDTGYVSIARADANGYFNFLSAVEETEYDAAPDTSAGIYTTGDELVAAVSSDNDPTTGDETYPRWFVIQRLDVGAKIYALPLSDPLSGLTEYKTGSVYKYKVNYAVLEDTGQTVTWLEGATPYWIFGDYFDVYGRVDNAGIVQSITNKGTVGTSVNDGSTWDDTSTEVNANFTLVSDSEDFAFEITGEAADVAWGIPTLAVSSSGQVQQYEAVLVFATTATAISPIPILADGWLPMNKMGLTNNATYYYVIDPVRDGTVPSTGNVISARIPITIDDSGLTASTEYSYGAWMLDWQNVNNVKTGAFATALPTVYGFLTEYGSDTVNQATAPTGTSSILTPQLSGYFTTNA